jgi:hypothetical protein
MRTSFHHQPEAQHPNFQLPTSWQADYPIFRREADMPRPPAPYQSDANDAVDGAHSAASRCHRVVASKRTT